MVADRRLALREQLAKRAHVDLVVLQQVVNDPEPSFVGQQLEKLDEIDGDVVGQRQRHRRDLRNSRSANTTR